MTTVRIETTCYVCGTEYKGVVGMGRTAYCPCCGTPYKTKLDPSLNPHIIHFIVEKAIDEPEIAIRTLYDSVLNEQNIDELTDILLNIDYDKWLESEKKMRDFFISLREKELRESEVQTDDNKKQIKEIQEKFDKNQRTILIVTDINI